MTNLGVFEEIQSRYPNLKAAYPAHWPQPDPAELRRIETEFGITFSAEFHEFQLVECHRTPMGKYAADNFGWAHPELEPIDNLAIIVADAQSVGVPRSYAPFKCDNGDYYCLDGSGKVVVWDHHNETPEQHPEYVWPSFSAWVGATIEEF